MKGRTTRSRKHSGSQGGGRGEHGATLRFGVGGAGHTVRTRMLAVALRVCAGHTLGSRCIGTLARHLLHTELPVPPPGHATPCPSTRISGERCSVSKLGPTHP